MIRAVGLDLVDLSRIRKVLRAHPERFLSRHFTDDETRYCLARHDPVPSLAARFAAKEAFQKCWPRSHGWRDVWVVRTHGRPHLAWSRPLERALIDQGLTAHLSLSHARDHAAAVVVLEAPPA
ncbi:MAG: 4'-phosphopantetheinyl transferase superfamily protein [Trueperaceae bacterium]|nr:4'-phosphopantetheinyl transferase superfamily protein [Trueperaceae bacterium]